MFSYLQYIPSIYKSFTDLRKTKNTIQNPICLCIVSRPLCLYSQKPSIIVWRPSISRPWTKEMKRG